MDIIILGDLNCNLLVSSPETKIMQEFISTFNLNQMVEKPTRIKEITVCLIDVIMTTNKSIISFSDVLACSVSDHHLVWLVLTLKTPRPKPTYISTRSYSDYNAERFREDLKFVPFHMISMFDDFDDQVDTFNALFIDVVNDRAPV